MKSSLSLGERMKSYYEQAYKQYLPWRMPVIIRIDGRSFHTFTRRMKRPFDETFISNMMQLGLYLCQEISTCVLAYGQSDEISFLLHNYRKLESQAWFGNEIQKIVSISSGLASSFFAMKYQSTKAVFDSRVFVLPEAEVCNYFIWRQQDATRNSIQMFAQDIFSAKQLHRKNQKQMLDMLFDKDRNWYTLPSYKKQGWCVHKRETGYWLVDKDIPVFTQDRDYIELLLEPEQEEFQPR